MACRPTARVNTVVWSIHHKSPTTLAYMPKRTAERISAMQTKCGRSASTVVVWSVYCASFVESANDRVGHS